MSLISMTPPTQLRDGDDVDDDDDDDDNRSAKDDWNSDSDDVDKDIEVVLYHLFSVLKKMAVTEER